jgi:L-alanine-DL-glutamate epimerase-like enolase superfamily enzyme
MSPHRAISRVRADAWEIPTDGPEVDGMFRWDSTMLVVVRVEAGGRCGLGYTYAHRAACTVAADTFAPLVTGRDAFDTGAIHADAVAALRNAGHPGIGAMAVPALDVALWDLEARLLGLPLPDLFPTIRDEVPVYGSGGFTSYTDDRLREQLQGWVGQGIGRVKFKIGTHPADDPRRVRLARDAIGDEPGLMFDANGALDHRQALAIAESPALARVDGFEEPVPSDDLIGLHRIRECMPPPVEVAVGEYGWDLRYFEHMPAAGAVDVLQADATRCGGYTGSSRPRASRRRIRSRCRRIARRRCTPPSPPPRRGCAMSSISTTTSASNGSRSTVSRRCATAGSCPIAPAPAMAWSCARPT